jgi:hypothetical protein
VHPFHPEAPEQVRYAVERLGLRGLKLHHACDWFELDSPEVRRLLALCGEWGIPVLFHSPGVVGKLVRLAEDVAHTALVFGHMGGDSQGMADCLAAAARLPHVYLETSSSQDLRLLREAALAFPDRVLFGTDAIIGPERRRELDKVRGLDCSDEIKGQVLGGNAARLLGL